LKLLVKKHSVGGTVLLAICDPDVLGRTLVGPRNARITVKRPFYGDTEMEAEDLQKELPNAVSINAIGRKSVNFLLSCGYGNSRSVIEFEGVPHMIFMRV
jgi:hypothetical protein